MIQRLPANTVRAEIDLFATQPQYEDLWYITGGLTSESAELAALETAPPAVTYGHPEIDEHDTLACEDYTRAVKLMRRTPHLRHAIDVAANARQNYAKYSSAINDFRGRIDTDSTAMSRLGAGESAEVYSLALDGDEYALHTFRAQPLNDFGIFDMGEIYGSRKRFLAHSTAQKAAALALGDGIPGLTRLSSYSTEDAICISTIAPGKRLDTIAPSDVRAVSFDHLNRYVFTLAAMHQRGLEIDPNPGNVFWHPNEGFTIIDCHRSSHPGEHTNKALGTVASALMATNLSYDSAELRISRAKMKSAIPLLAHIQKWANTLRTDVDFDEASGLERVYDNKFEWQ
jgi:hypothetical protein